MNHINHDLDTGRLTNGETFDHSPVPTMKQKTKVSTVTTVTSSDISSESGYIYIYPSEKSSDTAFHNQSNPRQ